MKNFKMTSGTDWLFYVICTHRWGFESINMVVTWIVLIAFFPALMVTMDQQLSYAQIRTCLLISPNVRS